MPDSDDEHLLRHLLRQLHVLLELAHQRAQQRVGGRRRRRFGEALAHRPPCSRRRRRNRECARGSHLRPAPLQCRRGASAAEAPSTTVPTSNRSSRAGRSISASRFATSSTCLSVAIAASSARIELSVPTNSGCTPWGYTTMSRSGRTGISVTTSLVACFMVTCFNGTSRELTGGASSPRVGCCASIVTPHKCRRGRLRPLRMALFANQSSGATFALSTFS